MAAGVDAKLAESLEDKVLRCKRVTLTNGSFADQEEETLVVSVVFLVRFAGCACVNQLLGRWS